MPSRSEPPRLYTAEQVAALLDLYFRDHPRPTPFPTIADALGLPRKHEGLDDLLWKLITGYAGREADGRRRFYAPAAGRQSRVGQPWHPREEAALRAALAGEGQRRHPPVDVAYIAAVLARAVEEVVTRWELIRDPIGRTGFGLGAT